MSEVRAKLAFSSPQYRAPWRVLLGAGLLLSATGVAGITWHPNNMITVGGFVFAYLGFGFLVELFREMLAAGSLDSHLGGARTLILPGRIGLATRESA